MPIIKSAKKRQEIAIRNNARNKSDKSELATAIKKFNAVFAPTAATAWSLTIIPKTVMSIDEKDVCNKLLNINGIA